MYIVAMPRAALSDEAIADFRARLTAVATRLFAEHGFEGVTLRAVASDLGVSPMTPYRYVAGKDELFVLVRTEAFRRFADHQERAARARGGAIPRLRALGKAYVRFALAEPDAYRIMFALAQPDDGPAELRAEEARSFAPLHEAVAAAVSEGALRGDPLTLAHLFWATTHGLVTLHLAGKLGMGLGLADLTKSVLDSIAPDRRSP